MLRIWVQANTVKLPLIELGKSVSEVGFERKTTNLILQRSSLTYLLIIHVETDIGRQLIIGMWS